MIAALSAAVAADPGAVGIRLYLAALLANEGRHEEAQGHFAAVLDAEPGHPEALSGAAAAAEALSQSTRTTAYRDSLPQGREGGLPPAPDDVPDVVPDEPAGATGPVGLREWVVAPGGDDAEWERPTVRIADIGGLDAVKRRLELAFCAPLRNPDLRRVYGKSLRGGLLLYGPPGCGKTFLARAVAGELGARFRSVGLTDVLNMYLGQSEQRLHQIFEAARRNAPAVLFFDELDALGHKRSQMQHHGGRGVVNVLLAELDGVAGDNEGIFTLGATNQPWDVDPALRRPGRFDRMVLVLPPDDPTREAIMRYHLRDRPAESVDTRWVARRTREFSGADLAHLCDTATELALERAVATGTVRPMTTDDFKAALREVGPSTRPWFDLARNFALYANEGGMYDDIARRRFGEAEEHLRRAEAMAPAHWRPAYLLGVCLWSQGRREEGIALLHRAVRLDPGAECPRKSLRAGATVFLSRRLRVVGMVGAAAWVLWRIAGAGSRGGTAVLMALSALVVGWVLWDFRRRRDRLGAIDPLIPTLVREGRVVEGARSWVGRRIRRGPAGRDALLAKPDVDD